MSVLETAVPITPQKQILTSTITAQNRPARPSPLSASLTLGWRALLKLKHVPSQLVDVTIFPILMTLLMTYLFGGALAGSVEEYVQQLIPGILVLTIAMISSYTALGLNTDITKGLFDRFRSLPFWRPAVLVGALLGDTIRYTMAAGVVIVLGLLLGFRPETGLSGVLLSLILLLVFAFSLSWVWTTLALLVDNPESLMMVSGMTTFPLTFISNVFVDPATMPEFLQKFVHINPISLTATVMRGLMHGNVTTSEIATMLLACVILITVFAPLTMYLYNNKNTV
ncbi:MAG: ABC transporter permease [Chloroflexi bacterium]|nr:MAG: ABC transporter permease [Chloroflexota bacterium]